MHKIHLLVDVIIVVNINIIAETDWTLVILDVFVNVAYSHIYYISQSPYLPMLWHIPQPFHS